jgi:hypothetical protein
MSAFAYYLPHTTIAAATHRGRLLAEHLPDVLQDCRAVPDQCVALDLVVGPDPPGVLLYPKPVHGELPPRLGWLPETQTWRRTAAGIWIGWETADPPRPTDLERTQQIPGYHVRDEYGEPWVIPIARAVDNPRGNLPYTVHWTADERPVCGVGPRFAAFWADSARLWDLVGRHAMETQTGLLLLGAGLTADEDAFVLDMVIRALQINYRVGPGELAALDAIRPGWLSQTAASLAANAIVDMHARATWDDAQKKTESPAVPAGVSSTPGGPADSPTSVPAAES